MLDISFVSLPSLEPHTLIQIRIHCLAILCCFTMLCCIQQRLCLRANYIPVSLWILTNSLWRILLSYSTCLLQSLPSRTVSIYIDSISWFIRENNEQCCWNWTVFWINKRGCQSHYAHLQSNVILTFHLPFTFHIFLPYYLIVFLLSCYVLSLLQCRGAKNIQSGR